MPAGEAYKCGTMDVLYQHIETPLFVLENQYDEEQIFGELHVPFPNTKDPESIVKLIPYLKYYGERMRKTLTQVKPPNGLWSPACLDHCATFSNPNVTIEGIDGTAALRSWYDEKGFGSRHLWSDTCGKGVVGIPCNKGCPLPIAK